MSLVSPYMHPATLISYDKVNRTAQVTIPGLTDGVADGITAMLAYPIGDDDLDTERELINGTDVWVFFEQGDITMPVIAFYRRHGQGRAVVDIRRIRQKNIEVLARSSITLTAKDFINVKANKISIEADVVDIKAGTVNVNAETNFRGDINQIGDYFMTGNQTINGGQAINGDSISYGNQTINGNQTTNGSIYATIDIKAGDVSVRYHLHPGVETGGGNTGAPK